MGNTVNKWCLHRAGLLNYWYYDDEEFEFAGGRLLLRGNNGSGKSVTMQSLITIMLDGVKSPDRLDSFGSRSRRMEDYLLGEKEIVNRDERTGYLYLEYKRQTTEQYLTTGIGLQAKRNGGLDFWGFVITNNRRIKYDLLLYKPEVNPADGSEQRIPLTRPELERTIGEGGQVVRSQNEYMELVNRHIFGFKEIEQYQELMKLLIQLRSPKLSKDFKPSVIYEILNESLPSLSDDELRPLSDTIESMERTKLQIEQLVRDSQSLGRLCRHYDLYNRFVLTEKAELAQKSKQRLSRLNRESSELTVKIEKSRRELTEAQRHQHELEQESTILQREKSELEQHDVFRAEEQKQECKQQLKAADTTRREKQEQLTVKQRRERDEQQLACQYEDQAAAEEARMAVILPDLDFAAETAGFEEHLLLADAFRQRNPAFSFAVWRQNIKQHQQKLAAVLELLHRQTEIRKQRERLEQELSDERLQLDKYRAEHRKLEQHFMECRDQLLASFYQWRQQYEQALPMEQEELRQTAQSLQGLYEGRTWNNVRAPVEAAYGRQVTAINRELGLAGAKLTRLDEQEVELNRELTEWQQKSDPEPERSPEAQATRERLAAMGVPLIPFYAAVEFRIDVAPEMRERIEAAIRELGLLDALIVPEKRLPEIPVSESYGAVVHPRPQIMTATLADYLTPIPDGQGVSAADIDAVLRSIVVEDTVSWNDIAGDSNVAAVAPADGTYRMGLYSGHAPHQQDAVYIGKQARERYRQQQIAILEEKLMELGREQEQLYAVCTGLRHQLAQAGIALEGFLQETEVRELYHQKLAVWTDIGRQEQRVEQSDARLRVIAGQLQAIREQLQAGSAGLKLQVTEEAYHEAVQSLDEYQRNLHELELSWRSYENNQGNAGRARERLVELAVDVDELKGEILLLDGRVESLQLEIARIEGRMREMGADELRERVRRVAERLALIPGESKDATALAVSLAKDIEAAESKLAQLGLKIHFYQRIADCWQQAVDEELRLGLVYPGDQPLPGITTILQQNERLLRQDKLDRLSVNDKLISNFHIENNVLMEYRMQLEPVAVQWGELPQVPVDADPDDGLTAELDKLFEKSGRQIITLDYEGRRQNPYQIAGVLEQQITEQRAILSEHDKELYEEVIMNSIGRIISHRIQVAQQWVADMNKLMGERDNSSGLKFKLEWKARMAEQETEMDTQDLVRLLHADPAILREEDLRKMVHHFQLRIERAKQASEATSPGNLGAITFQRAVREVLDYRLWFQFKLYFEQSGITWRELTDKMFFKFSGGEKAMAMYIPLFSAVYSRYQEARADAPYIITLDEAFAGVDENNIRDTFALVEQLGFNYIMNSQALWGDYDVVPALAIAELIRPKNAPYVTVVRYFWNGRIRSLKVGDEAMMDAEDLAAAVNEAS